MEVLSKLEVQACVWIQLVQINMSVSQQNHIKYCVICFPSSSSAVKSFRQCFLSWFFLWHLVWLSVMQLRHYFFIGTLNPMLLHLTKGDPSLGKHTHTHTQVVNQQWTEWLHHLVFCLLDSFPSSNLSVLVCSHSESLHQCFCYHAALWRALRSLEWSHHGPTQGQTKGCR